MAKDTEEADKVLNMIKKLGPWAAVFLLGLITGVICAKWLAFLFA